VRCWKDAHALDGFGDDDEEPYSTWYMEMPSVSTRRLRNPWLRYPCDEAPYYDEDLSDDELIAMLSAISDVGAPKLERVNIAECTSLTVRSFEALSDLLASGKTPAIICIHANEAGDVDAGMILLIRALRNPCAPKVVELRTYDFLAYDALASELHSWPASLNTLSFHMGEEAGNVFDSFATALCATPPPATLPATLQMSCYTTHDLSQLLSSSPATDLSFDTPLTSHDVEFLCAALKAGCAPNLHCITLKNDGEMEPDALDVLQRCIEHGQWPNRVHLDLVSAHLKMDHFSDQSPTAEQLAGLLAVCEAKGISLCGAVGATDEERLRNFIQKLAFAVRDEDGVYEANEASAWLEVPWRRALIKSTVKLFPRALFLGDDAAGSASLDDAAAEMVVQVLAKQIADSLDE